MSEHEQLAVDLFLSGAACCQSVLCAFCDVHGLDRVTAARLASSMGGGVGRLRQTCGAVTGAALVMGLLYGFDYPPVGDAKGELYAAVQEMLLPFRTHFGTFSCRELLEAAGCEASELPSPETRTPEYFRRRPCPEAVRLAARALDEYIAAHPVPAARAAEAGKKA